MLAQIEAAAREVNLPVARFANEVLSSDIAARKLPSVPASMPAPQKKYQPTESFHEYKVHYLNLK